MELKQLRYLLTIAECRNMTKAAEKLYISQSALSHYLRCVEDEVGVRLFDRTTTPLTLTYAGECYMKSARRMLQENDRLQKEIRDITQHMTGKLTVGVSRDRASYMMPRILPKFAERYPNIEVEVFTASGQKQLDALRSGRVDLVILPDTPKEQMEGLCREKIYSEEIVLAAKKGSVPGDCRCPGRNAVKGHSLDGAPFFLLFQEHAIRNFCNRYFRAERIRPEVKLEFSSSISCMRMAATGMGYAIIPYLITQLANPGGDMEYFSLREEPATWNVDMLYRKGFYLGTPEKELLEIAREEFAHEGV